MSEHWTPEHGISRKGNTVALVLASVGCLLIHAGRHLWRTAVACIDDNLADLGGDD